MGWVAGTSPTQLTSITQTIQWFAGTGIITRNPGEEIVVDIDVNFGGTTDDAVVYVQHSSQGTPGWSDEYYAQVPLAVADSDPRQISFHLLSGYKYRFGVASTGATDSHAADMYFQTGTV